jgi:dipicolinate synthase subunit A
VLGYRNWSFDYQRGKYVLKRRKFTIIGGDLRNVHLANLIESDDNEVNILGFNNANFEIKVHEFDDLSNAISGSDIIIGPLPCSNDDELINTPFNKDKIYIKEAFKLMTKNQIFIAGRISDKIKQIANVYNVYAVDILEREEMSVLNAIPTAEGAIQIAMEEMPITLHGSNALVLGFGRVGKVLSKMLLGIGANVYVEARNFADIAWIRSYGYKPVHISELETVVSSADVIFNTIPHLILNNDVLKKINKNCLVIDLASKPGGVDFRAAGDMGIKTIWALSLPGKVAPVTAAGIIKDTVYNIINELGV